MSEIFLYLTTTGHKSGRPHRIEIWFVGIDSRYYVISEQYNVSHWVKNIRANPQIHFTIGTRDQPESTLALIEGRATFIVPEEQPDLAAQVRAAMQAKYNWSTGLIVQLEPAQP
jgi:general stress protein 26